MKNMLRSSGNIETTQFFPKTLATTKTRLFDSSTIMFYIHFLEKNIYIYNIEGIFQLNHIKPAGSNQLIMCFFENPAFRNHGFQIVAVRPQLEKRMKPRMMKSSFWMTAMILFMKPCGTAISNKSNLRISEVEKCWAIIMLNESKECTNQNRALKWVWRTQRGKFLGAYE